jgi:hypothetical protein
MNTHKRHEHEQWCLCQLVMLMSAGGIVRAIIGRAAPISHTPLKVAYGWSVA